jgi:NitT/TauT family transport system permease protein
VSSWPFVATAIALATLLAARKAKDPLASVLLPLSVVVIFLAAWQFLCDVKTYDVVRPDGTVTRVQQFPTPWQTLVDNQRPILDGTLLKFSIRSIYRVAMGFLIAVGIGIPLGLWAGWYMRAFQALNPLFQFLRPISPIAWIPFAIIWFGIDDEAAIFLIALASFFPIVTGTLTAVRAIPGVYVRTAHNYGIEGFELFRRVVFPACLPQIVTSLRIGLGIAWMVIVAAEMMGVDSGLGYQILDSRNGNNYARVAGAMVTIGLIGVGLDLAMRRLEHLDQVRWGFSRL